MNTIELPPQRGTDPRAIAVVDHLHDLASALASHGARIRVHAERATIVAANPTALGASNPLEQTVVLALHDDETMHWYWHWPHGTHPHYEYMRPAGDVTAAARQIALILRLTPVDA